MHETDILPTVAKKCPFSGIYKHFVCMCVHMCMGCLCLHMYCLWRPNADAGRLSWLLFTLFIEAKSFSWTYSFPILASVASHLASVILYLTFPKSWNLQVGHHTHFHGLGVKTPALTLVPTVLYLLSCSSSLSFVFFWTQSHTLAQADLELAL